MHPHLKCAYVQPYTGTLFFHKAIVFFIFCFTDFFRNKLGSEDEIKIKIKFIRPFSSWIKIEGMNFIFSLINKRKNEEKNHNLTPVLHWHESERNKKIRGLID